MASGETKISLRDDQDFNIWFVKEIEKVSCLYNYTDPCYTNRQKQDEAWQKIASDAHVGGELRNSYLLWTNMKTKMLIIYLISSFAVTDCKERWKNLRACFTRHLKHKFLEAKSGIRYKKPYYLAEHMNFILPYTKLRSQSQEDLKYYEEIVKQQHLNQPSKQQIQQQQPQTQQRLLQEHRQQIDNNIIYLDATENSNDDEDSPEYDFEPEIDADMMYAENSMYSSNDDQLTTNRGEFDYVLTYTFLLSQLALGRHHHTK